MLLFFLNFLLFYTQMAHAACAWDSDDTKDYSFEVIKKDSASCGCFKIIIPWKASLPGCLMVVRAKDHEQFSNSDIKVYVPSKELCSAEEGDTIKSKIDIIYCDDQKESDDLWLAQCGSERFRWNCKKSKTMFALQDPAYGHDQ